MQEPIVDPAVDGGEDLRARVCELVDGTPVHPVTLGRLLCGARLHRLVVGAVGEVLDAGRDIRYANRAQRRALRFRHAGHCAFPGCDAPDAWCEAHHIEQWEHGGLTDMDDLIPLCRFHHHLVHEGGWVLAVTPDGTVTVDRPPQPGEQPRRVTPVLAHNRPREPRPDITRIRQVLRTLWRDTGQTAA